MFALNIIGDTSGLIHLISASIALIFGTLTLIVKKGTNQHKKIGYIYVTNMVILIASSFLIYRLFKGWGIFHYTSVISLITLTMGMIPVLLKKPVNKWKYFHFSFMYWSVIGLYAAFCAEIVTRIPKSPPYAMLGLAIAFVFIVGSIIFGINKNKWKKTFSYLDGHH